MNVLVERYQRRKYVNQENAPMLYYCLLYTSDAADD